MALTATLIGFAAGLAARLKPISPPSREAEKNDMKAEIARLKRDLALAARTNNHLLEGIEMLERELATERNLKLHWRDEASRFATEARLRREAQERHAQASQQALQAYNARYLGHVAQGLLGAQNLALPAGWDCTCIPDRASALGQG
jgi:hypothetical protein